MLVIWESHQQAESQGVKFATKVTTCQAQGLPEVVGGLTRGGAPFSVWPSQEKDTVARAAAKRAREVIMVTDRDTAYQPSDREERTARRGKAALRR